MRVRTLQLVGLILLLVTVPGLSGQAFPETPSWETLRLNPGDAVRVVVWQRIDLSGEFKVGLDGWLLHPLYKEVLVAGVPFDDVQVRIGQFLENHQANPRFVVEPLFRIRLGGEVSGAGVILVPPETTVSTAVWNAGGPTERGRLDRVTLVRDDRETTYDLNDPGPVSPDMYLRSGDEVIVARRHRLFRDYVVPFSSIVSAVWSLYSIAERATR